MSDVDAERDGDEHRVQGSLERAEDQGRHAEFRLVVVGSTRRLPHAFRAGVPLVPHRPEQRPEVHFGMRVVDPPPAHGPVLVGRVHPVGPRGEGEGGHRRHRALLAVDAGATGYPSAHLDFQPRARKPLAALTSHFPARIAPP